MAPKHHSTPLSGGGRKALNKELGKTRAMTNILAAQSAEMRAKAETMLQQADRLLCESWCAQSAELRAKVGQPLHPDGRTGRRGVCVGADVVEDGPPILGRQLVGRADGRRCRRRVSARGSRNGMFLHLFSGRHAPACRSVGHVTIRT